MDNKRVKEISYYITSLILCLFFLIWLMQLWSASLFIPFIYGEGDSLGVNANIKGIIETRGLFENPYIGMPTGFFAYDYPANWVLDRYIMIGISFFFPNWAFVINFFFLLTFFLTTITTLYVLRQFNVSPIPAIAGSLLFSFLPYHFLRGESHLDLASYFLIPLLILVVFWIFEDEFLLSHILKGSNTYHPLFLNAKNLMSIIICFVMALEYIYYPFFSCFFLLIAGFYTTISHKKWSPLLNAVFLIGIMVLTIFITTLPTILYQYENGINQAVAQRSPGQSEDLGLKIIQLLLPISGHRIPFLAHISNYYSLGSPLVNENSFAALGMIGSIGFIFLLLWVFYLILTNISIGNDICVKKISQLSALNLSAVLLATIGSFGTIFAYILLPEIRAYNRISIFIAFFCIVTIVLLLDRLLRKYSNSGPKKWMIMGFIFIILLGGLYDQTSPYFVPDYENIKVNFQNDEQFIKNIETTYPDNTYIFQLPYIAYPENPPINRMGTYDHFRGYLHSDNIHWSFGAMEGREADLWQKNIAYKSTEEMIENLSFSGFTGIYVDSWGYIDGGKELLSSLSSSLGTTPIISENQRFYFFDMTEYTMKLKSKYSMEEWAKQKNRALNPLSLTWTDGFYPLEGTTKSNWSWRWSSNKGTLIIMNPLNVSRNVIISTTFFTGDPMETSQMKIECKNIIDTIELNSTGYHYQKEVTISPGRNIITFSSNARRMVAPNDPRYLVFRMDNFQLVELE